MAAISAVEAALLGIRDHQIPALAGGRGEARVARLRALYAKREPVLTALMLLGALAHLGMAVCGLLLAPELARSWDVHPAVAAGALFAAIVLIFDAAPKAVALARPGSVLGWAARPALVLERLLRPALRALGSLAGRVAAPLVPRAWGPSARIEDDEVATLVKMRQQSGDLPDWEAEVIHEVVKLGDKTAKDIMTPRVDLITAGVDLPDAKLRAAAAECPHRLLPLFRGETDEIVAVLDTVAFLAGSPRRAASREPVFVPETMSALSLFETHLAGALGLVVVLDEYGGVEGIATRSDVLEDLLRDAAPAGGGRPEVARLGGGRFLIEGAARLEDLEDELGGALCEEGIDTIGGLLFTEAGEVPVRGWATVRGRYRFTVAEASGKRIEAVLAEPIGEGGQGSSGGEGSR